MRDAIAVVRVRGVLLVTVPSEPTDEAVHRLQHDVLQAMEARRPKGAILDVSAVDVMDSFFARTLSETARMVELMGGPAVVTGMRPAVAITAMELGVRLEGMRCALNVDRALDLLDALSEPLEE